MTAAPQNQPVAVNPTHLDDPRPFGYSTAVIAPAGARMAYISGQYGQVPGGDMVPDFEGQVAQSYANLAAVLEAMGARSDQVVKLSVYVVNHDMSKLGVLSQAVMQMFGDHLPAQTLVSVPNLAIDPMLFEVDAIVALD